jgi:acetoin utilization deacetylase AcuC-like enzyme
MKFGNLVLVLEGGYDLDALAECASACIKVLSGDKNCIISERTGLPLSSTLSMIKKVHFVVIV